MPNFVSEEQQQEITDFELGPQGEDYELEQLRKQVELEHAQAWRDKTPRITEKDHICTNCVTCYKKVMGEKLPVTCNLSYQLQAREEKERGAYKNLSEEDKDYIETVSDPVAWAKLMFDWDARDFQREILSCTSQKKVVRAGRRVGKSEVMAVMILYLMYIKPNKTQDPNDIYEVIVVCPYEYQVGVLFDKMRRMIYRSDYLHTMVDKARGGNDKKEPQQLQFSNGARVTGFTASVRTGGQANKVRGQDANALFIDEMDYLDRDSIESMMALFASDRNCLIWASSTPSGKRENFYEWCTDKSLGFRESHYTSRVSPEWSASTELFYRSVYSRMGFLHEFLAEFGESEHSVFHATDIDKSLEIYDYRLCKPNSNDCIYTIGVDWNTVAFGTHIVIVEYSFKTHKMRVVGKEIVDAAEFTQRAGVNRVIELNEEWNPTYIYVDQGFGHMQIETLHEAGIEDPSSGLRNKVKGINMAGNTIVRDPASKQEVKKPTKPFMVDLAARRVEVGQCILPKSEDTRGGLVWQMRNYEVIGWGTHGQPKFTKEDEHTLTAWMLAIHALVMEHTSISKASYAKQIRFVAAPGTIGQKTSASSKDKLEVPIYHKGKPKKANSRKTLVPRSAKLHRTNIGQDLASARRMSAVFARAAGKGRLGFSGPQRRTTFRD